MGWPNQWDGCPPGRCWRLIQDLPERKTHVSTVRIKNKLCNGWIPVFCSSGTVQSCYALTVAHSRLSHSWKLRPRRHLAARQTRVLAWREVSLQTCSWLGANWEGLAKATCLLFVITINGGSFRSFFPDLGPDCRALPLLLHWALRCLPHRQQSSRAAPSSEDLAGATAVLQQGRTTGGQRESERCCQVKEYASTLLSTHSASDCSYWPHCGFRLFNWSPVSTPLFPLTELGSTPGQNISTPLWPASIEDFPVPEYGVSESFV